MPTPKTSEQFLTFADLAARWPGQENHVRKLLCDGELIPWSLIEQGQRPKYLLLPFRVGTLDCNFSCFSERKDDPEPMLLSRPMSLDEVMQCGCIELSQVLAQEKQSVTREDKALQAKARNSLTKLVFGMAVKWYGFDHRARRSAATHRMAEDLRNLGLAVDDDTVRLYLYEGADKHSSLLTQDRKTSVNRNRDSQDRTSPGL